MIYPCCSEMGFRFAVRRAIAVPLAILALCYAGVLPPATAQQPTANDPAAARRGYDFILNTPLVPADFPEAILNDVWEMWPEPLRTQAERATPEERRQLAFSRYGLTPRPDDPTKPLQYVVGADRQWTLNCFGCHGGKVAGRVVPGLPNAHYALQTLTEETRALKVARQTPLGRMDLGSVFVPLGSTNGTTNAVMFGVVLMHFRDADLNVHPGRSRPKLVNHDMDAPPWWHFKKKKFLYIDGFASKGHRGLSQFAMVPKNGPQKFRDWEASFRDVYAYLESLEAPRYPFQVDQELAAQGEQLFHRNCAECHGTYGANDDYPERLVAIEEVGTDRTRLDALTPAHRRSYGESWFNEYGQLPNRDNPGGYVAPPLDGVWASAPYLHNGSVPTLWHLLNSAERPVLWQRSEEGYDTERVGLEIRTFDALPAEAENPIVRRQYFDTRGFGKSAAGHTFPEKLSPAEKDAVLEYLKTL
jgi:mono/diheme cytochrome c family protein